MAISKDRVLFKEQGVLVTYERFVEPQGGEYRIADILSVAMEIVDEEIDRPPVRWWRIIGGSAVIGGALAAIGGFSAAWLQAGFFVVLAGVGISWWANRTRSNKIKVYHVIVTFPTQRDDRQEHRIVSSTSRFFSQRLKTALERAVIERPARYEHP